MTKKPRTARLERLKALEAQAPAIREACMRFISEHRQHIAWAEPDIPAEFSDRAAEIWEPLLVLADLAGGAWPRLAAEAAVALSSPATGGNAIANLIGDVHAVFQRLEQDRLLARTIVEELNKLSGRPWLELASGRTLDERILARNLRKHGITARTLRSQGKVGRGYLAADFGLRDGPA